MVLGLLIIITAVCMGSLPSWCCCCWFRCSFCSFIFHFYHHLLGLAVGMASIVLAVLRMFLSGAGWYVQRSLLCASLWLQQHTLSSLLHLLIIIIIASNNFWRIDPFCLLFSQSGYFFPSTSLLFPLLLQIHFRRWLLYIRRASFYVRPKNSFRLSGEK